MEEEEQILMQDYEPISIAVCKCLRDDESSEKVEMSERKERILSTVARTESYLRERRIPELIRFLLTKVIAEESGRPVAYLEKLLTDCMLFRSGHGLAPVLYETRHLEAVLKSFDPGQRGWLSAGQMRRTYITLGITPDVRDDDRISTEDALASLKIAQETDLFDLVSAGSDYANIDHNSSKASSSTNIKK